MTQASLDRRSFIATLVVGLLAAPLVAEGHPTEKVWRIGYLSPAVDHNNPIDQAFDHSMQGFGYIEGRNLRMERRYVAGQPARFGGAAADLVSLNLDLIVVWSTSGMLAVKEATSSIPVVFLAGATGSWTGVAGLPRPGGNLTGITFQAELEPKYLQILKELIPNLTRVALIRAVSDNNPNANQLAEAAAGSLGLKLFVVGLTGPEDLAKGFGRIVTEKSQALVAAPSGLLYAYRRQFVEFAAKNRLPTIYGLREVVADGGLLSLSPSLSDIATRGTYYIDRILKGAKPADLPVEPHEVRAGPQPQDRQGPRPDDPAVTPAAGGSGDRVMDRRAFLGVIAGGLLAAPLAAEAQSAAKVPRIGYLAPNLAASPHLREAFRQGLRDLGYVESQNVVIEYRSAEGKPERLPALAAELVALKVDVIVGPGTPTALAARQATRTLPIVFATAADPVGSGLVTSLARPGGNVTGLSILAPELVGKRLELLTQVVPGVSRVAVLWQPGGHDERTDKDILKDAEVAARPLGVRLQFVEARGPADFDRTFSDMTRAGVGALTVLTSVMFLNERRRLVDLTAKNRLPAVYGGRDFVDAGGLMAYGPNLADLYRRAATYVDKILKGAKPGDLPVEQPTKFELVINLKTAKALGLTIPPALLQGADQVIE